MRNIIMIMKFFRHKGRRNSQRTDFKNTYEEVDNTQWPDGADFDNLDRKQEDHFVEFQHSPMSKNEAQREDSNSLSKPPGFEAFNSNSNTSHSKKSHQSYKQPSHFSSAPIKPSRT
ncbi:hypothetical protein Tco_0063249, partial [Tanacetum coccineum]